MYVHDHSHIRADNLAVRRRTAIQIAVNDLSISPQSTTRSCQCLNRLRVRPSCLSPHSAPSCPLPISTHLLHSESKTVTYRRTKIEQPLIRRRRPHPRRPSLATSVTCTLGRSSSSFIDTATAYSESTLAASSSAFNRLPVGTSHARHARSGHARRLVSAGATRMPIAPPLARCREVLQAQEGQGAAPATPCHCRRTQCSRRSASPSGRGCPPGRATEI